MAAPSLQRSLRGEVAPVPRRTHLDLVKLLPLMERTTGRAEVAIGLIDGPVALGHPDLADSNIKAMPGHEGNCVRPTSAACNHGTFVAGILVARRGSVAPGICPGCTLLLRPIFIDPTRGEIQPPSASPKELTAAIVESIEAGAWVINLSAGFVGSSSIENDLEEALDLARRRGVIVVAAAGNQAQVGSTALTRYPWVIPVVAYDRRGWPSGLSNVGGSIGRRGLGGPGEALTSLAPPAGTVASGGTSVAAPFVTGAIALLWSQFPKATPAEVWLSVTQTVASPRRSVVPPLLDASAAYRFLAARHRR